MANLNKNLRRQYGITALKSDRPIVTNVVVGSPAAKAGLMAGDVILDINRKPVSSSKGAKKLLRKKTNVLRVLRGEQVLIIYMKS